MTTGYKKIAPENIDKLALCTGCGSVVYNTEENRQLHTVWHEHLDSAGRSGS